MLAKFKQRLSSRRNASSVLDGTYLLPSQDLSLPIHSLPFEVLAGEIFPLVVHSAGDHWLRKILVLDQVCTRWRHILHSSPLLWTNCIPINTIQFSRQRRAGNTGIIVAKYLTAVKKGLARSSPLPVHVSLDWSAFRPGTDDFACAVDVITEPEIRGRWKSLHIDVRWAEEATVDVLRALKRQSPDTLDALIEVAFKSFPVWIRDPAAPFTTIPNHGQQRLAPLEVVSIPWSQLTKLSLMSATSLTCRTVLVKCTNLVSAGLEGVLEDDIDLSALSAATLTRLSSLHLSVSQASMRATGKLILPALTRLELFYDTRMVRSHPAVFSLLPLHNIQKLTLNVVLDVLESADLCALLRCTPAVTELKLDTPFGIENVFLNALRADVPVTELLLPRLEMLWFHGGPRFIPYSDAENAQALAVFQTMVMSRVGVLRRLVYKPPSLRRLDKPPPVTNKWLRGGLMLAFAAFSVNGLHVEVL
ncbi:hypothetical protein C8F04DRAFT_1395924 [Mycena alexandri]|uniref:F-box domain-containing protein n=1 Tax=Mycena alexandri TaxID=1745969 RepID=A0AAD6STG6_9AGAR|nr:hypothetical protein C8F04DRAFT_1395924 [Mycena alexandri]